MKRTRALASAAAAVAAASLIAGCGGTDVNSSANLAPDAPPNTAQPQNPNQAPHNQADITFLQGMIPHHKQAIEMARAAPERAQSEQVKHLAKQVEAAQRLEIETMSSWLRAWGVPESSSNMHGMDHGTMDHGGMNMSEGMMSPQEMRQFERARGTQFDQKFLTLMIKHHQGAVTMAQTELDKGHNPEAKLLAQQIIDAQKAEIGTLKKLLGQK